MTGAMGDALNKGATPSPWAVSGFPPGCSEPLTRRAEALGADLLWRQPGLEQ
jgi:hypothetical protein